MAVVDRRLREMIIEAVRSSNHDQIASIAAQLAACARAHATLRAKGYGDSGMAIDYTVREVPTKDLR